MLGCGAGANVGCMESIEVQTRRRAERVRNTGIGIERRAMRQNLAKGINHNNPRTLRVADSGADSSFRLFRSAVTGSACDASGPAYNEVACTEDRELGGGLEIFKSLSLKKSVLF
ncbi:hypothetical protein AO1008_09593 [Aspergillus oryzae 100-8]|uniref:Uncharacterized protein n=1 Tax=Aspergillus oryzae (strain 3.042) TaxID=1160506 RepID=I8TTG6_ASPO3|nr:hypothetical protein Ao3042_06131 [Aspergillus oryzae 3.042]KDE83036.1 hypothetical protein AO1008_09593 [Aspergillus oryzae 100-8]|eukprot:EIT77650.1 hypothetical protein Ao3042_06131 [Aspergillus oryzae 3.042]